ncbi:MAG: tRNA (guanosine(46)-N7)-methyltransferase TrmB [Bacteroidetes bacterium]|nr:tRNA (guanosine(46)-N7)-methyltransferase TrmB [Bacteroidota bacterium]
MPNKIEKFAAYKEFSNTFTKPYSKLNESFELKGKWNNLIFKNQNPICIELGCGRGEYTIGLAKKNKQINYIGIDIKSNRMYTGAKQALDENLTNVAFLRTRIDFIEQCFDKNEISEIWITFPDPQPQKPRERKRLTNFMFLSKYKTFLKNNALIKLKTDSLFFYDYTLSVILNNNLNLKFKTDNLYTNCPDGKEELIEIKTYYESLFFKKGFSIKYLEFSLD